MKTVCISGQFGSGKSTAADIIEKYLPNSAIIHSDSFWVEALKKHKKEFRKIFNFQLDIKHPTDSIRQAAHSDPIESLKKSRKFNDVILPYIESEIEKKVAKNKKLGKKFVIIEYISLPSFDIWKRADCRILIVPNEEIHFKKLYQREITKRDYDEEFESTRQKTFAGVIKNAKNIDFTIKNDYDKNFEKDLIRVCEQLKSQVAVEKKEET
jgi:dephospho-CoA kinase